MQPVPQQQESEEAREEAGAIAVAPPPAPEPDAAPVPTSLDALIPADAVTNADVWAAAGVANQSPVVVPDDPLAEASEPFTGGAQADLAVPSDTAFPLTVDGILADFALEQPEPLPADPALEQLASIAAPVLAELPELAETRISSTLVLALPVAAKAFPEREQFVDRFEDLSTLRAAEEEGDSAPQIA
ncbi:MAG: outer membrane protein assembly factor, partial [Sphingomonadales bacterium]